MQEAIGHQYSMTKKQLHIMKTPVAFFVFNRPDTTRLVFEQIKLARPPVLFIIADGPRQEFPDDQARCMAVRACVAYVDWPCEVYREYADDNLGCRVRVSTGLDWVFAKVPEAIILEDDCLPHPTFFRYCEEMLEWYRNDERVMMVSGFNPQAAHVGEQFSYFFSRYPHIWGWASWRRAWKHYDVNMNMWPASRDTASFYYFVGSANEAKFWKKYFDLVYQGMVDTWDAQVSFMFFCKNGLAVFPNINLVSNIGFGADATHTKVDNGVADIESQEFKFPIEHPPTTQIDVVKDDERRKREYMHKGTYYKLRQLVARMFQWN